MASAQDGVLTVIICGDGGGAHVDIDLGDGGAPEPAPGAGDHCVFAVASAAAPPLATASVSAPMGASVDQATVLVRDLAPGRGLAAPPPPSQGPPRLT